MREKLVFILRNPLLTLDDRTDQTLSLMREEIKKELLTDEEMAVVLGVCFWRMPHKYELVAQTQLQKILKKMEEK